MVVKLLLGILKGLGGPDLEKLAADLPAAVGEELGQLILRAFGDEAKEPQGEAELKAWLDEHQDTAAMLLGRLWGSRDQVDDGSLIPDYVRALNAVVSVMDSLGRPIVLKGFFHDGDCLSYWRRRSSRPSPIERHPSVEVVSLGGNVSVYIIEEDGDLESVRALNRTIRRSRTSDLEPRVWVGKPEVESIYEFHVKLRHAGEREIPDGVPGMFEMLRTLELAVESQNASKTALRDSYAQFADHRKTE